MEAKDMLRSLGEIFSAGGSVKNVYGEPVTSGGRTVIPVARIRYGFGAGGGASREGDQPKEGGGGGGGLQAHPAGVVEITPAGTRFIHYGQTRTITIAMAAGFLLGFAVAGFTRKSD
jgi:uncharacterized spore protein YtfJ